MQLRHFTLCAASLAASVDAAASGSFVQASSLKQLPLAVQQQLGVGDPHNPIADRGERFNPGCVVLDATPQKRFLMGAVADDVVVVAIETGGIVHQSTTLEWRRQDGQWVQFERRNARRFPRTLQELLQSGARAAVAATV